MSPISSRAQRLPDAAPAPLRQWVRFKDLRAANIVSNWPQLLNLIATEGFPVGRYFGPNSRAWAADEVEAWLETRPVGIRRERDKRAAAEGVQP